DAELARLLAELERAGLAANTLVVVVADHGDEFLEHGALGHRRTLFREVVDVPVLLRWPAALPAGLVQSGTRGLADVAPTVLALLAGSAWADTPLGVAAGASPLGRLIVSPSGELRDVRVLESFALKSLEL